MGHLHEFIVKICTNLETCWSVLSFAVVRWGTGVVSKDANKLNALMMTAGAVLGSQLVNLEEVVEQRLPPEPEPDPKLLIQRMIEEVGASHCLRNGLESTLSGHFISCSSVSLLVTWISVDITALIITVIYRANIQSILLLFLAFVLWL